MFWKWEKREKWWQAFLKIWLFLLGFRLWSGELFEAYQQSWWELFRWIWPATLISGLVVLVQGWWRLRKKRKSSSASPLAAPSVSPASYQLPPDAEAANYLHR